MLAATLIAVVLTGTWVPSAVPARAVVAAVAPVQRAPGEGFAADTAAAFAAGAELRVVELWDRGNELRLELTLVRRARAERFTLVFDGAGQRPLAYTREVVEAPAERRVYRHAGELAALLASGPLESLSAECGAYFAEGERGGAAVDPHDYFVVASKARGVRARKLVARALSSAIDDGLALTAATPATDPPAGASSAIELVLFDGHEEILHVGLDPMGHIVAAEVRWSPVPSRRAARRYEVGRPLARALRTAGHVETIAIHASAGGGGPSLTLTVGSGARLELEAEPIELDELALADTHCPC